MSATSLVPVSFDNLPSCQVGDDAIYNELARGGDFLKRLQLYGKGKAIDRGQIKPGHYGIPDGEEIIDLGNVIDVIPFGRRPKAIDMTDHENLIVKHDPNDAEFKRIAAMSSERDSHCMYGPAFLLYERKTGQFVEFFCGTKSLRTEAKRIYPFLSLTPADIKARGLQEEPHGPLPFTLKSKLIEKPQFSWWVPVVVKCSNPFTNLPPVDKVAAEITRFVNPSAEGPEKLEDTKKRRAR